MEMKSFDFEVPVLSKTTLKWHQQQKKQTNNLLELYKQDLLVRNSQRVQLKSFHLISNTFS